MCPSVCVYTAVSDIWSRSKFLNDRSCTLSECWCRQNGRSCTEDSPIYRSVKVTFVTNVGFTLVHVKVPGVKWLIILAPRHWGLRGFLGRRSKSKCKVWWPQLLPWAGISSLHGKVRGRKFLDRFKTYFGSQISQSLNELQVKSVSTDYTHCNNLCFESASRIKNGERSRRSAAR